MPVLGKPPLASRTNRGRLVSTLQRALRRATQRLDTERTVQDTAASFKKNRAQTMNHAKEAFHCVPNIRCLDILWVMSQACRVLCA